MLHYKGRYGVKACQPCVAADFFSLRGIKDGCPTIGVLLRREVYRAGMECLPQEKRIVGLVVGIVKGVTPSLIQHLFGIVSLHLLLVGFVIERLYCLLAILFTQQFEVEYIEERVGNQWVSAAWHPSAAIGTTDIGNVVFHSIVHQLEDSIRVGQKAVFIHIDGNVAIGILQDGVEIAVCCLVGEPDAGIAQGLIQALGQTIEPQVERAAEELDTWISFHFYFCGCSAWA